MQNSHWIFLKVSWVSYAPPILCPFPYISQHVVKAITVRWESCDRGCSRIPILSSVQSWKLPLPRVCHVIAIFLELIPPGKYPDGISEVLASDLIYSPMQVAYQPINLSTNIIIYGKLPYNILCYEFLMFMVPDFSITGQWMVLQKP